MATCKRFALRQCTAVFLVLTLSPLARAETAYLLKDINPGSAGPNPSSDPAHLLAVGSTLYFTAGQFNGYGIPARELWKSDGTYGGTDVVTVPEFSPGGSDPQELANVGGTIYYSATDYSLTMFGRELWKSDGSVPGTLRITDVLPSGDGSPYGIVGVAGQVCFAATTVTGPGLVCSDGTPGNQTLIRNFAAIGTERAVLGNDLFFDADDGIAGRELWVYHADQPAVAGVNPALAVDRPVGSFFPTELTVFDGQIYYVASFDAGYQLVSYHPTLGPNFTSALTSFNPEQLTVVGSLLFLRGCTAAEGCEPWKFDPSQPLGSKLALVRDINPGPGDSSIQALGAVGSLLYLGANDGTTGVELWKSDGTFAGTVRVKDIWPGGNSSFVGGDRIVGIGSTAYFAASDGSSGEQLWKSDGTLAGTVRVKQINAGGGSTPRKFTAVGTLLFFSADDGVHGVELWRSDGTEPGTLQLKDINLPDSSGASIGSRPIRMTTVGSTLFFSANDGEHGFEPWKTDGTYAGTQPIKDINPTGDGMDGASSYPGCAGCYHWSATSIGGKFLFEADDSEHGMELWASNGSAAGTVMLKDINPGLDDSGPFTYRFSAALGGYRYFSAYEPGSGQELWRSNGTPAGTKMVADLRPGATVNGPNSSDPLVYEDSAVGGRLLFTAVVNDAYSYELLACNAPCASSADVVNLSGADRVPNRAQEFVAIGGFTYFTAYDGIDFSMPQPGHPLWRTDGTEAGTVPIFNPGSGPNSGIYGLVGFGTKLVFTAYSSYDEEAGYNTELWVLDTTQPISEAPYGESTNPRMIDLRPGLSGSAPGYGRYWYLNAANGKLFFFANNGTGTGFEPWMYDPALPISPGPYGAATNPKFLKDICPGSCSSVSDYSTDEYVFQLPVGGTLYFNAYDGVHGAELWKTDGTAEGTQLVQDICPGPCYSFPHDLALVNNRLVFGAYDGVHGAEPWVIDFGSSAMTLAFAPPTISGKSTSPTPVAEGPAGTYQFTSKFCLISGPSATGLFSRTAQLTNNNSLISRTRAATSGAPGGVGSEQDFAANLGYSDGVLSGDECTNVLYKIGLSNTSSFSFRVNLFGNILP